MSELLETSYEHLKGSETFTVTAAEKWSIGMVQRLKERYPEQVDIVCTNTDGSLLARMPFEWMRIVPKRRDNRSADERMAASSRMVAARAQKQTAVQREKSPNLNESHLGG